MSSKRELSDSDEGEISEPSPKRAKKQTGATPRHQHQNSSIDPTWGQKYVFSSLQDATTIPYGEESDFEDDADAMAYLMSVRKEAYDIPHLLVAPKVQIGPQLPPSLQQKEHGDDEDYDEGQADRSIYTNATGDFRGYYDDGAYIAAPEEEFPDNQDDGEVGEGDDEKELHEAYFSSIMTQYSRLRRVLHSKPPPDASKRLSSARATYAAPFGRDTHTNRIWANMMRNMDPHPLQLALMSKETVIRILRVVLGGTFLRRGHTLTERTSQWLWGLLARLPDRGELNHVEIGWVRDLGRRAVLLGRSLAEMAALRDELEYGQLGVNEGVDASSTDEDVMEGETGDVEGVEGVDAVDEDDTQMGASKDDQDEDDDEDGQVQESEAGDVAMDLADSSDSGQEDEVAGEDLEAAKRNLLARLNDSHAEQELDPQEETRLRLRMNMRATLNMILTVAGEFYGQRDLLEFREPFVGM